MGQSSGGHHRVLTPRWLQDEESSSLPFTQPHFSFTADLRSLLGPCLAAGVLSPSPPTVRHLLLFLLSSSRLPHTTCTSSISRSPGGGGGGALPPSFHLALFCAHCSNHDALVSTFSKWVMSCNYGLISERHVDCSNWVFVCCTANWMFCNGQCVFVLTCVSYCRYWKQ